MKLLKIQGGFYDQECMRAMVYLYILSVLLITSVTWAAGVCPIDDVLEKIAGTKKPEILEFHADAKVGEREYTSIGTLVKEGGDFQITENTTGTFLYIITDQGERFVIPRIPHFTVDIQSKTSPVIATHRALYQQARRLLKRNDIKIIGAGEFKVRVGKLIEFNNRAGTFRGLLHHLYYSAKLMKEGGLEFPEGVRIVDYSDDLSRRYDGHGSVLSRAILVLTWYRDVDYARFISFYRKLTEVYPHPTRPASIDINRMLKDYYLKRYGFAFKDDFLNKQGEIELSMEHMEKLMDPKVSDTVAFELMRPISEVTVLDDIKVEGLAVRPAQILHQSRDSLIKVIHMMKIFYEVSTFPVPGKN